jgi:LysM repeat protein
VNAKPLFVLLFFIFFIAIFASGSVGSADQSGGAQTISASSSGSGGGRISSLNGNSPCGSTYVVKSGDSLSMIAQACQVALAELLAANPAITNQNLIAVGQKVTLYKVTPTIKTKPSATPTPSPTPVPGVAPGDTVTVEVRGFPPNAEVRVGIGKYGILPTTAQQGRTDATGSYKASVTVPVRAKAKEKWKVTITTVKQPGIKVTSEPFLIRSK